LSRPHRDQERVLHIARLHYEDRRSQGEIARDLGVSAATVSRHLRLARTLGLVETRVASSAYRDFGIEAALVSRLGLASACVVRNAGPGAATERVLAGAAARRLDECSSRAVVGVSNRRTVAAVVAEARRGRSVEVDVVTLIGGIGRARSASQTGEICRTLAERLGGRAWILPSRRGRERRDRAALRASRAAAEVLALVDRLSVAVFGVGSMGPGSSTYQHGLFAEAHLGAMAARGAVGSICARFYDGDGAMLRSGQDACTLSIGLDRLARVPVRFAIACGPDKVDAIRAAIRGRAGQPHRDRTIPPRRCSPRGQLGRTGARGVSRGGGTPCPRRRTHAAPWSARQGAPSRPS
jgi:DNA-binding transcriptional regulator LsrR (DeoR family)